MPGLVTVFLVTVLLFGDSLNDDGARMSVLQPGVRASSVNRRVVPQAGLEGRVVEGT